MTRAARILVLVLLVAGLGACAQTVSGSGRTTAGQRLTGPGLPPTSVSIPGGATSPVPVSSPVSSPGSTTGFVRTPKSTIIGDPPTADLCTAWGTHQFASTARSASVDHQQYDAACSWTLPGGDTTIYAGVNAVSPGTPPIQTGGRARVVGGLRVTSYPATSYGECDRRVEASDVIIDVTAYTANGKTSTASCRVASVLTTRTITVLRARRTVPRIKLASVGLSVAALDLCAVLRATDVSGLDRLVGLSGRTTAFGARCSAQGSAGLRVSVSAAHDLVGRLPDQGTRRSVDGRDLVVYTDAGYCLITALATATPGGGREQAIFFLRTGSGAAGGLCTQGETFAARFLTTAGIR